ncbi:MAG: TetR/AcrR family transcriptional regulator [Marinomonas sp.]
MNKRVAYHHGNLKETLVVEMLSLLEEQTLEEISLRKLAKHVGVTPTAVYNHFADKHALLAAVTVECLKHFANYLENGYEEDAKPIDQLISLGKAYYSFACEFPHMAGVLFDCVIPPEYVGVELIEAGMLAEAATRKVVCDLLIERDIPLSKESEALGTFMAWSLSHGVTALSSKKMNQSACITERWPMVFAMENQESIDYVFDNMGYILVEGLVACLKKDAE